MTTQHTPGPWQLVGGRKDSIKVVHRANKVATVWKWHPLGDGEANARLIAAAPALLAAAEEILVALDFKSWPSYTAQNAAINNAEILLRAAIKLAKGEA